MGTAKSMEDETIEMASTHIGTYLYMSPEMRNRESYEYKTDVWYIYFQKFTKANL